MESPRQADLQHHILGLAESVSVHRALDNRFYPRWMTGPLTRSQVEVVARNFTSWVTPTKDRILKSLRSTHDPAAFRESWRNLGDEAGCSGGLPHAEMVVEFFDDLVRRLGKDDSGLCSRSDGSILPATRRLNLRGMDLFGGAFPVAMGALLAQEWHAWPQLVYLYEGVRNYRHLYGVLEFAQRCEYFYLHIGAAEREHKEQSLESAVRSCNSYNDLHGLEYGFQSFLDLLGDFWEELAAEIEKME